MTKVASYVQIDVPHCSLTYSIAPCQASLTSSPPTGTIKCFNSLGTCQDRANFTDVPVTLTFGEDIRFDITDGVPVIDCYPLIKNIDFQPSIVSLGDDLGQRATLTVTFKDAKHSDPGTDWDKYPTSRTYTDPYNRGTFWGKFRARNPFLRGRSIRLYRGPYGQPLSGLEVHYLIIDSIDGPNVNGDFKIIAKDVLKLADGDRSVAPNLSSGFLTADIIETDTTVTLSPAGIGASEYPVTGYASIGGNEAVYFTRDTLVGNDSFTKLLLHFDGADASTTFTDASSAAHGNATVTGTTQVDVDFSKFGGASVLFNRGLTYADHADWDLDTGNFTIDCWVRFLSVTGTQHIAAFGSDVNNCWRFIKDTTTNFLKFEDVAAGVVHNFVTGTIALSSTGVWYHVAVTRSSTTYRLFVNGVLDNSATDASAIANRTGTLAIGSSITVTSSVLNRWMDEFRLSKGVARWTASFTPPISSYQSSAETLTLTRGQLNTTAATHSAQDRVQVILAYEAQNPASVIQDLMVTYAGISSSYIALSEWITEIANNLGVTCTFYIAEPTSVRDLINELILQFSLAIWWDDTAQQVRLQVLRAISTDADRYNEDNTLEDTLQVQEQPEKRISQVIVYFAQINPLLRRDDLTNYRSTATSVDTQSEIDEGSAAIKIIYARSIASGGRSIAERIGDTYLGRYVRPPRRFNFELMRYAGQNPALGQGIQLGGGSPQKESWPFQDETGARVDVPLQITRFNPMADKFVIEAEEMLSSGDVAPIDPNTHNIIFDTNSTEVNLRTVHDSLYGTPTSGQTVNAYVNTGIIIGSTNRNIAAFDIGTWPAGVTVTLTVRGRIQGKGGDGGAGTGTSGLRGGLALKTTQAISLILNDGSGQIWGGGGGGGGAWWIGGGGSPVLQYGGGGGAGSNVGLGGTPSGANGTTEAGGIGAAGVGGTGGGPGLAGGTGIAQPGGSSAAGLPGGAAGTAIDGVSFCSKTGTGDIRGSQIN